MSAKSPTFLARERRQHIVETAATCFDQRGFHQTTIQNICAESGMSAGAIYNYFPNKAAIVAGVIELQCALFASYLSVDNRERTAIDSICSAAETAFSNVSVSRGSLWREIEAEATRCSATRAALQHADETLVRQLTIVLERSQQRDEVDSTLDCHEAALVTLAVIRGLTLAVTLGDSVSRIADNISKLRLLLTRFLPPRRGREPGEAEPL